MRKHFFIFGSAIFVVACLLLMAVSKRTATGVSGRPSGSNIIACAAPFDGEVYRNKDGKYISLLPGWGNHSYHITTNSDSAQIYFNQGLTMYYGYHPKEAVASFKEASRFDSSCAMTYWGIALAMGPPYNYGFQFKLNDAVYDVLTAMNRNTAAASASEKDLIDAMNKRYDPETRSDKRRIKLNEAYATAMQPLVKKYANDLDIMSVYVDAVMLVHSWDFWNNDGTPKPWTGEIVDDCAYILKHDPHHPAALHYYIHVTEASHNPGVALANGDSLVKLFPGIAHMVHMASHEYERMGQYSKGIPANESADKSLALYHRLEPNNSAALHVPHYFAVEAFCALSGAASAKALSISMTCRKSVEPTRDNTYQQYLYMFPELAMVRLGKWNDLISDSSTIDPTWAYALLLSNFGRGMAYARTGNVSRATDCLNTLRKKVADSSLSARFTPYMSSPHDCGIVAEHILEASILFAQNKREAAITSIKTGIVTDDNLLYAEPKLWMLPARQYLGMFLMRMDRYAEAEKVYRDDLLANPGNGWSLMGLYQALTKEHKTKELKKIKSQYLLSFTATDAIPVASAY